jgi:hypothetical protein
MNTRLARRYFKKELVERGWKNLLRDSYARDICAGYRGILSIYFCSYKPLTVTFHLSVECQAASDLFVKCGNQGALTTVPVYGILARQLSTELETIPEYWIVHSDAEHGEATLDRVIETIEKRGVPWLQEHCDIEKLVAVANSTKGWACYFYPVLLVVAGRSQEAIKWMENVDECKTNAYFQELSLTLTRIIRDEQEVAV